MKDHRPKPPPAAHIREFQLPDGRRIAVDRRSVAFAVQCKEKPAEQTVLAFRAGKAGPCPVMAPIDNVLPWWSGEDAQKPTGDKPPSKPNGTWKPPRPKKASKRLTPAEQASRAAALAANKATEGA